MAEHEPDVAPAAINRRHVESYLAEIASTRSASTAQTRYKAQGAMPHRRNGKA